MYHFDLHYDIVRMRHDELVQQTTHRRPGGERRRWFGRLRRPAGPSAPERSHLVAVASPPPRHAAADHDTQVA